MPFVDHIPDVIARYGYLAVFCVIAIESAGIPLPGETILLSAAIFAGTSRGLDIGGVIAAAAGGAIIGDNFGFWAGRRFGFALLARYGRFVGLDERRLRLGQYLFQIHGGKIVFFGRFVVWLRAFAAVLAGANRLDPKRFFVFNALGGVVWASLFGTLGFVFGAEAQRIATPLGAIAFALALVMFALFWRLYKKHEARLMREAEAALPLPIRPRGE